MQCDMVSAARNTLDWLLIWLWIKLLWLSVQEPFIVANFFVISNLSYVTPYEVMTHSLRSHGLDKLPSSDLLALGCFDAPTKYLTRQRTNVPAYWDHSTTYFTSYLASLKHIWEIQIYASPKISDKKMLQWAKNKTLDTGNLEAFH